jgi:D(-)-tartrate dehydratase
MNIIEIIEQVAPISSAIKNTYIDSSKIDCSLVVIKTDQKINREQVVGYGFHSNGRYAVNKLLKKRFIQE